MPPANNPLASRVLTLAGLIVVVVALRYAQDLLVPFILAILFSFLLTPLVDRFERRHFGRIFSVMLVVGFSFFLIGVLSYIVGLQLIDLGEKLPEYKQNIHAKVEALRQPGGLRNITANLVDVGHEFSQITDSPTSNTATVIHPGRQSASRANRNANRATGHPDEAPAVKVEIVSPPSSAMALVNSAIGPLLQPVGTASVVIVLTIFIMIYREDLRDRLIRLIGEGQIHVTTQALDDAATRVSRYLLMQLVVNACFGIPVAIGLYFIGIPNALLWGVLATLLRFIPYLGAWIAASMPIVLSLAVFDGWSHFWMTAALFTVLELLSVNVIEVWLYSSHTGVSKVALVVAATFWTWLWGTPGLMLATPLTVCLAVLGRYVPQLEFFNILLGDQPVLAQEIRVYQRLLASHVDEARKLIDNALAETSLEAVYETLMLRLLALAERDRQRGSIDENQFDQITALVREIIIDLGERATPSLEPKTSLPADFQILCLPGRGEVDEIAALMLLQLLQARGFNAASCTSKTLASEMIERAAEADVRLVCISALPPLADLHARYLFKRLRARLSDLPIVAGLWDAQGSVQVTEQSFGDVSPQAVVGSFSAALNQFSNLLAPLASREREVGVAAVEETS